MDLFTQSQKDSKLAQPLAERLRPKTWQEVWGQNSLEKNGAISASLKSGVIPSLILWGPPGTGKTTLARSLSEFDGYIYIQVNAISTGAKKLREIGVEAENQSKYYGNQSLLFIDEIHRLNKSQQDVLLPFVESGVIVLVGATTENPSFEINSALLSRCRVVRFDRLNVESLKQIAIKACRELRVSLEELIEESAIDDFIGCFDGDARRLLNSLEVISTLRGSEIELPVKKEDFAQILGANTFLYSKKGDERYDLISALIKSIRGSDANAGLYYLARLIVGGEDVNFIARRLVILASEDVGNADPQGLVVANNAQQAVHLIGLPEAGIILAQAVTYLATAPKSNRSYMGYSEALSDASQLGSLEVPMPLRNAPTKWMKDHGYGDGYKYAHDSPTGHRDMDFLPEPIKDKEYYKPTPRGHELKIQKYLEWLRTHGEDA